MTILYHKKIKARKGWEPIEVSAVRYSDGPSVFYDIKIEAEAVHISQVEAITKALLAARKAISKRQVKEKPT